MPVAFRSSSIDSVVSSSSTVGISKPTGVLDGDFLVASIAIQGGTTATITPPAGWTLVRRVDNGTSIGLAVYYRFAQGEPSQWVWTLGVSSLHAGGVSAYTGVDSFYSVDAELGQAIATSTSHPSPNITTSTANLVCVLSYAASNSATYTAPAGTSQRYTHTLSASAILGCDTTIAAAGASGVFAATFGASVAAASHALALRPSVGTVSADQARTIVKSHFPPGASDLYDWDVTDSNLYALTVAESQFVKAYGYDWIDLLRREFQPATATVKLPDWEGALGISLPTQNPGVAAWTSTRQANIVGKLRESGTVTVDQIRGAIEPLLGYSGINVGTLKIVETTRGDFTSNTPGGLCQPHTYTDGGTTAIGANASGTITFPRVADDGAVSAAGVQIKFTLTSTNPEQLSFTLTGPTGTNGQASVTWAAATLPAGNAASVQFYLREKATSAGKSILGTWTLAVNTGAATATASSCYLFVEGAGLDGATPAGNGLGGYIFDWGVQPEIAKVGAAPDYVGARRALSRMTPAFANPHVIFQTQDSLSTPGTPTVTVVGATGATTYTYSVVARNGAGSTAESVRTTVTNGKSALDGLNYNAISWAASSGTGPIVYDVYRVVGGLTTGRVSIGTLSTSFNDQGAVGDGTTAPTTNTASTTYATAVPDAGNSIPDGCIPG